mmetsp:Transcript_11952/g.32692  ORF Transcript_11952/g.32692 Transcript_11952/m.32692 type:complete len:100 (-) Transcript_11952:77-376(-)
MAASIVDFAAYGWRSCWRTLSNSANACSNATAAGLVLSWSKEGSPGLCCLCEELDMLLLLCLCGPAQVAPSQNEEHGQQFRSPFQAPFSMQGQIDLLRM